MINYRWRPFLAWLLIAVAIAPNAPALNVQIFEPLPDSGSIVTVQRSLGLPAKSWQIGSSFNLNRNPIEIGDSNDQNVADLVNWLATLDLMGVYGITDRINLGLVLPINFFSDIEPLPTLGEPDTFQLGELKLYLLWQLWNSGAIAERRGVGIGLSPFISFPTAQEEAFVGNGGFSGGVKLIVDFWLSGSDYLSLNTGARIRPQETFGQFSIDDEFLMSAGYAHTFSKPLTLFAELYASTTLQDFFADEETTPVEPRVGWKGKFGDQEQWSVNAGVGRGATNGYGSPDYRFFGGLSYQFQSAKLSVVSVSPPLPPPLPPPPQPKPRPKAVIVKPYIVTEPIFFETNSDQIKGISHEVLNDLAHVLNEHPEIRKLSIEGHTDNVGAAVYNQKLSLKRARSVANYLIAHGIDASRLRMRGLGLSKPLADNATSEGRAKNRRVEFVIVEEGRSRR